ncbi:hypothetical protein ACHAXS_004101 [Conticribra weissflogii]
MLLAHPPHDGVLVAPLPIRPEPLAHSPPRPVTQALAPLHRHAGTSLEVALAPRRAVARAPPGDFDGLGAAGDVAQLPLGAVGHAHSSLDDTVGAVGEGAFAADSAGGVLFGRGAAFSGTAGAAGAIAGFFEFGGRLLAGGFCGGAGAGFALGCHGIEKVEETQNLPLYYSSNSPTIFQKLINC